MIDKAILKKHNLKGVPFSAIGEGETFWLKMSILCHDNFEIFARVRDCGEIRYASGSPMMETEFVCSLANTNVYVPVWRVTK